jgi:hypothetical protein
MFRISILQIGDIHYNSIVRLDPILKRDSRFPDHLYSFFQRESTCDLVTKDLINCIDKELISTILLSGDFLYNGDIDTETRKKIIEECLNFLKDTFFSGYFNNEKKYSLAIVPGNHDIEREFANNLDISKKFKLINSTLIENKFPEIPIETAFTIEVKPNLYGSLNLCLLNSCIGCGERRQYPPTICSLIEKYDETNSRNYEDIDTPLIDENVLITTISDVIKKEKSIPIILTHHNLMPQKTSKIAIYSDLINGGIIKQFLLNLNKSIIYLNGHIHQDPIEIITSPLNENSKIICISAPLLYPIKNDQSQTFGFNVINFLFNDDGSPLGCDVVMHRPIEQEPIKQKRIRFLEPPSTFDNLLTGEKTYFKQIKRMESPFYLGKFCEKINNPDLKIEELDKFFDKMDMLGFVKYDKWSFDQRDVPMKTRIIEGVMP